MTGTCHLGQSSPVPLPPATPVVPPLPAHAIQQGEAGSCSPWSGSFPPDFCPSLLPLGP